VELPTLDWSSAKVKDGILTVPLSGERPRGWDTTFNTTAKLLGGGDWGEVELKKERIKVTEVSPGVAERLRHFLESVVQQADATHRPAENERDEDAEDRDELQDEEPGARDDPDAALTDRFRAFGS
jgi:hypothetical protein